jgi:hypothetical protein
MLLNAEIKDDHFSELPRQQLQAQYAYPAATYLKADASTGKHYIDLNAAAKSYAGAWLFGTQNVQVFVGNLKAQWVQWCPVPAGIGDGVLLRGNVIYEYPNKSYRTSKDMYEGVIRTANGERFFEGQTQHTFSGSNVPNGYLKVVANLNIPLTQRLAYNPMIVMPSKQRANANRLYASQQSETAAYSNAYQTYSQPAAQPSAQTYSSGSSDQEPDSGF